MSELQVAVLLVSMGGISLELLIFTACTVRDIRDELRKLNAKAREAK